MDERRKPGTRPKGPRKAATVRLPVDQFDAYKQACDEQGYSSLGDYLVAVLADAHGLKPPAYIDRRSDSDSAQAPLLAS